MIVDSLQIAILGTLVYMSLWALVAVTLRRNDLADVAWGGGFVVVAWLTYFAQPEAQPASTIVSILVTVWGLRLSWHIFQRWRRHNTEDFRYQAMRRSWGKSQALQSYVRVFLLQGVLLLMVGAPILLINSAGYVRGEFIAIGTGVWAIGFWFESIADRQLRQFLAKPSNSDKIMKQGLWKYSRHPNYFGEITQWWGIGIIALTAPYGAYGLLGPVVITLLITRVSGVPLLEKRYANNPAYQAYARQTSVLIPLPPRS